MASPQGERAVQDALRYGNALLKFISPNDAGITGSHQCGFYLPRSAWEMYTPNSPTKNRLDKHAVRILWPDGRLTDSVVTWYGQKTRFEYRLTKFGRDFPYLNEDTVGDLLVLIPKTPDEFVAYVLDFDEDIQEVQAALGVEPFEHWGVYQNGAAKIESEDDCIERRIREFSQPLADFPSGEEFSSNARRILEACLQQFPTLSPDDALMRYMATEYRLFRDVERQVCGNEVSGRLFRDIDDFLRTASTIMNRRKARAGRSLENHVDYLLTEAGIPHTMRPHRIDGRPDIVIPDENAYLDHSWPEDKLFVVGVKTTCKDRWRQVLNEGRRVHTKHILTMQQGISAAQLHDMHTAGVTLIVPQPLHKDFPKEHDVTLLNLAAFITSVQKQLTA